MSDDEPPLDRALLLGSLQRHGVRFVLVGGLAAQAHGAPRTTKDADICPQWDDENLARPLAIDSISVLVDSPPDIIRSTEIANGAKDGAALDELRTLRGIGGTD